MNDTEPITTSCSTKPEEDINTTDRTDVNKMTLPDFSRLRRGSRYKIKKIVQSGLCVSGQTIKAALQRINALNDTGRSIIVNIGSVNIMKRRQMLQFQYEYRKLIKAMLKKGFKPILTTLAPLGNYAYDLQKHQVNEISYKLSVSSSPRHVSGAAESYLFWNKIGRQRI
ncbi:maternal effect protein oskar-like [Stomoxys calcitrans]|uniref:maternal effect protein oskar-like n=1 Tax=Stomoxys calcitrans TaxID=35570 RepID=UPI0027E24868|nr:maternal effect protein oskar-like [Stomoxys calcitrans]